jgi:hypothetical protein
MFTSRLCQYALLVSRRAMSISRSRGSTNELAQMDLAPSDRRFVEQRRAASAVTPNAG